MPPRHSRRTALGTFATGASLAVTGCLGSGAAGLLEDEEESDDWPAFAFDAANTGYAPRVAGPTDDAELAWTASVAVGHVGPPVVVDGIVYVGSNRGKQSHGQKGRVSALEEGEKRWAVQTGAPVDDAMTVTRDGVYVGSSDGVVHALDRDGSRRWRFDVANGTTVTATDERVYAVGLEDGLYALDSDGEERWNYDPGPERVARGVPAIGDDAAYVGGTALHAVGEDGSGRWTDGTDGYATGAPVLADDTVYAVEFRSDGTTDESIRDRYVVAVGASGTRRWRAPLPGATHVTMADGDVLVTVRNGLASLNATTGEVRWRYDCSRPRRASVAGEVAYVGTWAGSVHGVDTATGDRLWRIELEEAVTAAPAVSRGTVYVGTRSGNVHAVA